MQEFDCKTSRRNFSGAPAEGDLLCLNVDGAAGRCLYTNWPQKSGPGFGVARASRTGAAPQRLEERTEERRRRPSLLVI